MATFPFYGITGNNGAPDGPYVIRDFDSNSPPASTTPDRTFENGDEIVFTPQGAGAAFHDFHGYEDGTGYAILSITRSLGTQYVILFGDTRPTGATYSPSGTIVTDEPLRIGEPVSYADFGYRRATGDTDKFTSEDREVEFDHSNDPNGYSIGSTIQIRVLTRDSAGEIESIQERISARFDGYDRETGYPVFTDTSDNRQLILASQRQNEYDVPEADIVATRLRTGDVMFTNSAIRLGSEIGDGEFFITGQEVGFAHGVYEENDIITINLGGTDTQVTFVGYESDTNYPIFRDSDTSVFPNGRLIVPVNSNDQIDTPYNVDNVVTDTYATCFAPGTLIATPDGERPVETLAMGDKVLTSDGGVTKVKWVGVQKVPTLFGPPEITRPVRIMAGALYENTPHTDLIVTKDHGMIVDGVICNAGALVNGTSIVEVPVRELGTDRHGVATWYHVETENHVPLLANGAAAESFIDNVGRSVFNNHAEFVAMYGETVPAMAEMNMPRAMSARQLPGRVTSRLATRAAAIVPSAVMRGPAAKSA